MEKVISLQIPGRRYLEKARSKLSITSHWDQIVSNKTDWWKTYNTVMII